MAAPFDKSAWMPLETSGFEALTVAGTAVGFTAATSAGAKAAHVKVEGAQIRYRSDGTDPTATVGTLYDVGDEFIVWGKDDMDDIRFIRTGGVSATLNTHFAR